ncbi:MULTISPECIES: hypothetical protein [Colwellia]|uniref:Lipoprotein n=1 Tax=Colwellia marinimaniae TaxID=1513592 RepID=A0ABQ0MVF2_9GAMM|nr:MULTISPECIES: hypothetical protein [Colwellia]GAW96339.1 hypothetical protein MTCD1_01953 [Colwellia marinimaniae]
MKVFKIGCYLFLYLLVTGCSNSAQVNSSPMMNHYFANNFSRSDFTSHHKGSIKKAASSDHQLMFALLNRPMPEDQRMMLAFAKQQASYLPDSTFVGTHIKGKKNASDDQARVISHYAQLIEPDINAVVISAMPQ